VATSRSRETVEPVDEETERDAGRKGAPTPTRKQAEQARMQRLHPVLTKKEQKARDRQARARKRDEQYKKVEEMPERVLLRNNIDSHWSVAEFAWPVVFLLLACVLATQILPVLSLVGTLGIWVFFLVCAVNVWWRWRSYKREATERIPGFTTRGKGLIGYMMSRMITMRRFRNPGPAIKRGEAY
jgi:hypothetical protein